MEAALWLYLFVLNGIMVHANQYGKGRIASTFPAPTCCQTDSCLTDNRSRHAFVTSLRSEDYLVGLQELACSLNRSNPGVPLIVLGVEGDLSSDTIAEIKQVAEYQLVEDISINNTHHPRFALNWMKIRAWAMTEYDAIIMLDCDVIVLSSLEHIFQLPTDFAWTEHQGPDNWFWNSGGFVFLRPCKKVQDYMINLVQTHSHLQFTDFLAEQTFFRWYFKHTGIRLPMTYNANALQLDKNETAGGEAPKVVHFADAPKHFNAKPSDDVWQFLCWQPQQLQQKQEKNRLV